MTPAFLSKLLSAQSYSHPIREPIRQIETQVSWLLLTGDIAYKIKKPLDFGFLDFSSLEKRQFYCEEELRLNQRLAPDIYQQVVAIYQTGEQWKIGPLPEGESAVEYAVKMRQFDPDAGLDKLLNDPFFELDWIDQMAEQIGHFHLATPQVAADSPWGTVENIHQLVSDNYSHTLGYCQEPEDKAKLSAMAERAEKQFQALTNKLQQRRLQGFIRECHGDLHLANITLDQGRLRLFDCIEFNLQFRWIDTLCDLSFLLMDLEANGKWQYANRCLNRYLEHTGDYQGLVLLNFYKAFRAMIRAKIATLPPAPSLETLRHYLALTQRYQQPHKPYLVLMHGLTRSGKSQLSLALAARGNWIRLSASRERQKLYRQLANRGQDITPYGQEVNSRLYQQLHEQAETILSSGFTAVIDAGHLKQRQRQRYLQLAEKLGVGILLIDCQCDIQGATLRLASHLANRPNSQLAAEQLMAQQVDAHEPPTEAELAFTLSANTDNPQVEMQLWQAISSRLEEHSITG